MTKATLSDEPFVGLKHLREDEGDDDHCLSDEPFVGLKRQWPLRSARQRHSFQTNPLWG